MAGILQSSSKGCSSVPIEERIEIAHKIIDLNIATRNRRISFNYGRMKAKDHKKSYLRALPELLDKSLDKAPSGAGKNLIHVCCDFRSDVTQEELNEALAGPIQERGYSLLEQVDQIKSSFETVGLMYADLVGYLAGRVDIISNDYELFDDISLDLLEKSGKLRKLKSSKELIEKIKELKIYEHKNMMA